MKMMDKKRDSYSTKKAVGYGIGQFSDTIVVQMFNMYVFTFYFAVVGIDVDLITIAFIIWSLWNAFNDPMMGALSDRTKSRLGRRKPYIIIALIPLCLIIVFLFTPPASSLPLSFIYLIIMVVLFDISYTTFDLNYASLFPEMFKDLTERSKANAIKQIFTVLGLIVASVIPPFLIGKLDDPANFSNYSFAAIIMMIVIFIGVILLIFFGIKEKKEFSKDYETAPSFLNSLKISIKNKSFRYFIVANLAYWYVIGMLPMIVPLYGDFVLHIPEEESMLLGLLLGSTFISAAIFMILWRYIALKVGMKKGYMLSFAVFIITLFPLILIDRMEIAFIIFFLVGIGLSGALMFGDIVLGAIIDQDELLTKTRREGGFYGINALITKLSTILVILTINLVFRTTGWKVFSVDPTGILGVEVGLKILVFLFPAIALGIGIISILKFPINKEKYEQIKIDIETLHKEKRNKINSN
jgi:GPH family glycoside/pentoside/hexuronide:cation symporter